MRASVLIVIVLFCSVTTAGTAFAESRGILVELVAREGSRPAVNVYSDVKAEQKTGIAISEAALVLKGARDWGSMVAVYVLSEAHIATWDLVELLDGMKENYALRVTYVELGSRSETSKQLLERFRVLRTSH